jgi:crossover junction endodeoxyribonuclease RuvC
VLGLDPGSRVTGWGVVERTGRAGGLTLVEAGIIRAPAGKDLAPRLNAIYDGILEVIARHQPGEMSVEGVFSAVNVRTALVLGQARGVALLAGARAGLTVYEYPPASVKKALVGAGRAGKEQVRAMVRSLLAGARRVEMPLDASDACALAICHLHSRELRRKGMK